MARFRAKYRSMGYYRIQKHHWLFGWIDYDNKYYDEREAELRLMDIETYYPNVHPIDDGILKEIDVN